MKLWYIVLVVTGFVFGAVGADLQCADSQIKAVIENDNLDTQKTSARDFWSDIQTVVDEFFKVLKK